MRRCLDRSVSTKPNSAVPRARLCCALRLCSRPRVTLCIAKFGHRASPGPSRNWRGICGMVLAGAITLMLHVAGLTRSAQKLSVVAPLAGRVVKIVWADEVTAEVDLAPLLANHRSYVSLRKDDRLFLSVRVSSDGGALEWSDGCRVAVSAILKLPQTYMEATELRAIMDELRLSVEGLSALLGLSRRVIADYRSGVPIPKTLALAMRYLQERGSI